MATGLAIPVFLLSLAASIVSSLVFARRLDRVSERLGVSEGLHGILTALGADAPEISTAITALLSTRGEIGVGVVVGSNVFNLAALLGLGALIAGQVRIHRHGLLLNGGVALAVTAAAAALVLGAIGAVAATILVLLVLLPYVFVLSVRTSRIAGIVPFEAVRRFLVTAVREEVVDLRTHEPVQEATRADVITMLLGLAVIVLSSIGMVEAASDLGRRWGVSDVIVGTLVLASLTSIPNLLTAVRLALHRRGAAVVSESFNSNSFNVLAGIVLPGLALSLGSATGLVTFSVWWLVGMTVLAVAFAYAGHGLRRSEGAVIVLLYVAFAAVIAAR